MPAVPNPHQAVGWPRLWISPAKATQRVPHPSRTLRRVGIEDVRTTGRSHSCRQHSYHPYLLVDSLAHHCPNLYSLALIRKSRSTPSIMRIVRSLAKTRITWKVIAGLLAITLASILLAAQDATYPPQKPSPPTITPQIVLLAESVVQTQWTHTLNLVNASKSRAVHPCRHILHRRQSRRLPAKN
jgi:hypothetical protein